MKYISSWKIFTATLRQRVQEAFEQGEASPDDIVWAGPSGDAVIAATAADLGEEYGEYTNAGQVAEYLD